MLRTIALILAAVSSLIAANSTRAETGNDLVQAELIADSTSIRAGQPMRVAVKFTVEPGWHIYWSNPGETGMATKVKLELPDGFTAGDIQFPAPKRFVATGDITAYGYEKETLLMATIMPPAKLTDERVSLNASVSWLVCNESKCLPGKSKVSLELPVNAEPRPAHAELFEKWSARVPVQAEADANVVSATSRLTGSEALSFEVTWKQTPAKIDWFPPAVKSVNFEDVDLKTSGNKTTISCTVSPLAGQKAPDGALGSVVVYHTADDEPRGVIVPFSLTSNSAADKVSSRQ